MTQKNIELLLKDLSCRIPYGVIINVNGISNVKLTSVSWYGEVGVDDGSTYLYPISEIKPYLFPLSSMTEEQKEELFKPCEFCIQEDWEGKKSEVYAIEIASRFDPAYCHNHDFNLWGVDMRAIDWLIKNHFDYRGLIEKGLAIDATGLNIYD